VSFTLKDLAAVRPFLYHLTARMNVERIRRTRVLQSASTIADLAGDGARFTTPRRAGLVVRIGEEFVHIRDQAPLHAGNVRFEGGWNFERLLRELNDRVFFWPGTAGGPIPHGIRHFARYRDDDVVLIRVPTTLMPPGAEVCFYNSGSPRWVDGRPSPRGPATFSLPGVVSLPPSRTVEVTWPGSVSLPGDVQVSAYPNGPWNHLGREP
jgi:Family of unknown function (DUF7002)